MPDRSAPDEKGGDVRGFEFDVTLEGVAPAPWRRMQVSADTRFMQFHTAIQDACGWENYHLFRFADQAGRPVAGIPNDDFGEPEPDAADVALSDVFPRLGRCSYLYDFGDSWEHDVALVGEVDLPAGIRRRLVDGRLAFPPEDCGGLWGYEESVRVARGGQDDEDRREWLGDWHPDAFDLEAVKARFDR